MNKVAVISLNQKNTFYEGKIEKIAKKILQLLKKENCYLEIFLINKRKMKILNKKFRNPSKKQASILTFVEPKNFPHPESKLRHLGEIYLKLPITNYPAKDEARQKRQLLITLLAHGLLHLLGFEHRKKSDRIKMETREKFLISHV